MAIRFAASTATLTGDASVEEAGELVNWLLARDGRRVDLSECQSVHTSVAQSLLALRPPLVGLPPAEGIWRWLHPLLAPLVIPAGKRSRPRRKKEGTQA